MINNFISKFITHCHQKTINELTARFVYSSDWQLVFVFIFYNGEQHLRCAQIVSDHWAVTWRYIVVFSNNKFPFPEVVFCCFTSFIDFLNTVSFVNLFKISAFTFPKILFQKLSFQKIPNSIHHLGVFAAYNQLTNKN